MSLPEDCLKLLSAGTFHPVQYSYFLPVPCVIVCCFVLRDPNGIKLFDGFLGYPWYSVGKTPFTCLLCLIFVCLLVAFLFVYIFYICSCFVFLYKPNKSKCTNRDTVSLDYLIWCDAITNKVTHSSPQNANAGSGQQN